MLILIVRRGPASRWRERLADRQKPARMRKTRRFQMLLTAGEHKNLSEYAQQRDTTVSELMRNYIRTVIRQKGT